MSTQRQREIHRSVLAKLHEVLKRDTEELKLDWILLSVHEIHTLFGIAKREAFNDLCKRFNIK